MQTYDLIMLAIFAAAILFGAWKGLAWQVASVSAIFVSYLVALKFRGPVSQMIRVDPPLNQFIAMFAIYALVSAGIWIGFGYVKAFIERLSLRSFDRQAGALLGALKGGLLCIVVTMFAVTLLGESRRQQICQSTSGLWIARSINKLRVVMPREIHPMLAPYLNRFDDAMRQSNSEYARQPDLPTLPNGQGTDFEATFRKVFGELLTTNRSETARQYQGTVEGFSWPNQNASYSTSGQGGPPSNGLPPLNPGTLRDIFGSQSNQ